MAVEPNDFAGFYAAKLDKAQSLLDEGGSQNVRRAKVICFISRISPHLGVYARARINLILARSHQIESPEDIHNILLYAYGVLNLFDIYRQKHDGEITENDLSLIKSMEEQAKTIIDAVTEVKLDKDELRRASELNEGERGKKKEESEATNIKLEEMRMRSLVEKGVEPEDPKLVLINKTTAEMHAQLQDNRNKDLSLGTEEYLQTGGEYEDIVQYVPFSRESQIPPVDSCKDVEVSVLPTFEHARASSDYVIDGHTIYLRLL